MQVYDLAWSPSGEYIMAGSTDNVARVFSTNDGNVLTARPIHMLTNVLGKCVNEIAEHNHYVQGVAWDPPKRIHRYSKQRSVHARLQCY